MSDPLPTFKPPPVPDGVKTMAWLDVHLADLLMMSLAERVPPPRTVKYRLGDDLRSTIRRLLLAACEGSESRADRVIDTSMREGGSITDAFLRVRERQARRFQFDIQVPESGDELSVTEQPDGTFEVVASCRAEIGGRDVTDGEHVTLTLPGSLMDQLVTRYAEHKSLRTNETGISG